MNSVRHFQKPLAFLLALLVFSGSLSCYSRYRMPSSRLPKIKSIKDLKFIVLDPSTPERIWLLSNPAFEQNALSARFDRASPAFAQRISSIHSNAERAASRDLVLIYLDPALTRSFGDTLTTRVDYKNITNIEVFEPDAGKVVGLVFLAIGGIAAAGLIALIIACNCPHVYAEMPDGSTQFEGSLYSGAIHPPLERPDWLPLTQLQAVENQYRIRLANQESQHQHTNMLALEVLDHAPGILPLFDKYGRLHTLAAPQPPRSATDAAGRDVLPEVLAEDDKIFLGDLDNDRRDATERLTLTFAKPADTRHAKLLLHAKNSDWLDYTYAQFQDALGEYADEVARKYSRLAPAKNLAWAERQKIPLAVWLETATGHWEKADCFNLAGASAFRHDVLSLDLSRVQGEVVRLRLEFGFRFWEIDYAALDFSPEQPVQQTTLRPLSARTQAGEDITALLSHDDHGYYHQPSVGDEANIVFEVPPLAPGQARSLALHAKGWYEVRHQPTTHRPSIFKLKSWEKENALPRLSRERWRAVRQTN